MDTRVGGGGGNSSIEVLRCRNSRSNTIFIYPLCAVYVGEVLFFVYFFLACLSPAKTSVSPRSSPLGTFRTEETSPAEKSEEKRMFSQASFVCSCYLWRVRVGNSVLYP